MKKIIIPLLFFILFIFSEKCFCSDYIVALKNSVAKEVMEDMVASGSGISLLSSENFEGEIISEKLNLILVAEEKAKEFMQAGKTEFIEPDYEIELLDTEYNDVYFSKQTYYDVNNIDALKEKSNKGLGVRVGILDSGVYSEHTDLSGANIETGYNYVTDSENTNDLDNHGTCVTSLIVAQENNNLGIAGIAPKATVVPLVVYSNGKGTSSHIVKALMAAADTYNCDILNLSIGTLGDGSGAMQKAIDYVTQKGIIVVAAVGNKGNATIYYPASFDNVIGVGAIDENKNVASFSERNESVYTVVQGANVCVLNNSGGVSMVKGTSFSSPIVTAMLTLLLDIDNTITPSQMMEIVKKASLDLGDVGYDTSYGYGMLDGEQLYRAYMDKKTIYIAKSDNSNIYKYYSDKVDTFYVYYSVFEDNKYKYGEYKKITLDNNVASDSFTYSNSENAQIKAIPFTNFETLLPL